MGAESRCELRFDGTSHHGKALLETDELLVRADSAGAQRGVRLAIPLASIRSVAGGADGALFGDAHSREAGHPEGETLTIRAGAARAVTQRETGGARYPNDWQWPTVE